jgi:lipoic acid synthetase
LTGVPLPEDPLEPERLAAMAATLALRHVVVTSVTRDDLQDGGAAQFARTVLELRKAVPLAALELLVPDFGGAPGPLATILDSGPDVLNHNIETVKELYQSVRPRADYARSLRLLSDAASAAVRSDRGITIKSGMMVGLGETRGQIDRCLHDLADAGVKSVTIGQYLRPRRGNIPVTRYYDPAEFEELAASAAELGFGSVFSAPLVRSSYHAGERSLQNMEDRSADAQTG